MSDSLWCQGLYLTRLLRPWNSPSKNTGVGCHSLLQGIFPTQVSCIAGGLFTVWATREFLWMISIHTSISNLSCIYWTTGHLPFDVPQALEPELLLMFGSLHSLLSWLERPCVLSSSNASSLSFKPQACVPFSRKLFWDYCSYILELLLLGIHSVL